MGFLENLGGLEYLEKTLNALVQSAQDSSAIEEEEEINQKYKDIVKFYQNPDGKLKVIKISDKCSACGACMSYSDVFQDGPNGTCIVRNSGIAYLSDTEIDKVNDAIDLCPEQAISMNSMSVIKENGKVTIEDIKSYIKKTLVNYQFPVPQYKDFEFRGAVPSVDGDGIHGWSSSKYSSSSSAESAGLSELKRVYFNNMDSLSKSLLVDYKHLVLTPLMSDEDKRDNYYYYEKTRIMTIIRALCAEIEGVTGKSVAPYFGIISSRLDFGYNGKKFDSVLHLEDHVYGPAQQDLENPDWYESWIDTDDYEDTKDTLFGYKTITVYKYRTSDAWHEIENHMRSGARSAVSEFFSGSYFKNQFIELVKPIENEIKEKGNKLLEFLDGKSISYDKPRVDENVEPEKKQRYVKSINYEYGKDVVSIVFDDGTHKSFNHVVYKLLAQSDKYVVFSTEGTFFEGKKGLYVIDLIKEECIFDGNPQGEYGNYNGLGLYEDWMVWKGESLNLITGQRYSTKDDMDGFTIANGGIVYSLGEYESLRPVSGWGYNFYMCDFEWKYKRKIISFPKGSSFSDELYLRNVRYEDGKIYFEYKKSSRFGAGYTETSFDLEKEIQNSLNKVSKIYL